MQVMYVGDVVVPRGYCAMLHSGSSRYTHAIIASVAPFVLVSEQGDMLWKATVKPEDFMALCQAHPDIADRAVARWNEYNKGEQHVV